MADKTINVEFARRDLITVINGLNYLRDDLIDDALNAIENDLLAFLTYSSAINNIEKLVARLTELVGDDEPETEPTDI